MTYPVFFSILVSTGALVLSAMLMLYRKQRTAASSSSMALGICIGLAAISLLLYSLVDDSWLKAVSGMLTISLVGSTPALMIIHNLGFLIQSRRFSFHTLTFLGVIPVSILALLSLTLAYFTYDLILTSLVIVWGRWMACISIGLLLAAILTVVPTSGKRINPLKPWLRILFLITILINILIDILMIARGAQELGWMVLMLAGVVAMGVVVFIIDRKIPQSSLITRDEVFDNMNDGIIIINDQDIILDLNRTAENLVGIPRSQSSGISIEKVLANWKSISTSLDSMEKEFRGSINLNNQRRLFDVRITQLADARGKIITLRDVTTRQGTDETRQRAREEMFNLLRSFFKSANTSQSSTDFFRDVLFQIAYTFRAESGAILLIASPSESRKVKFSLMAKYGKLMEDKESLQTLQEALVSTKWTAAGKEPLIISEDTQNPQLIKVSQQFHNHCLAVFPLASNGQLMGVLLLARLEAAGFSQDDLVRLGVATEELASFMYSDKKRKADIALAERHRLAQDLHDSITQKLYGLVTLTEAVKLGLESGQPIDKDGMVGKIGDNARQALREMRLFLFELEPVNLERDGLVNTLQQRLASVEGRSGIQARMVADADISLSIDKETEIYYIVEEALNNILKHANAKSVLVKIKPRKESTYLEIVDNGCGFDLDNVKFGGKGLKNIRERAKRVKGRLNIISSPEHGTKITLVVPQ